MRRAVGSELRHYNIFQIGKERDREKKGKMKFPQVLRVLCGNIKEITAKFTQWRAQGLVPGEPMSLLSVGLSWEPFAYTKAPLICPHTDTTGLPCSRPDPTGVVGQGPSREMCREDYVLTSQNFSLFLREKPLWSFLFSLPKWSPFPLLIIFSAPSIPIYLPLH